MQYLKVDIISIESKRNLWSDEYQYNIFSSLREMWESTNNQIYYNMIVKKNMLGIMEIISGKKLFVLENNDDDNLKRSLKKLQELLNKDNEVYIVCRSSLDTKKYVQEDEAVSYITNFHNSTFAKAIDYNNCLHEEIFSEKGNKRVIKTMIKKYKNNCVNKNKV